jgi:hypothetical protein
MPNFTLEGHDKGVNCVDYFSGGRWCARGVCASGCGDLWQRVLAPGVLRAAVAANAHTEIILMGARAHC